MEADRQAAVVQKRVVEALQRETIAQAPPLVGAELESSTLPSR